MWPRLFLQNGSLCCRKRQKQVQIGAARAGGWEGERRSDSSSASCGRDLAGWFIKRAGSQPGSGLLREATGGKARASERQQQHRNPRADLSPGLLPFSDVKGAFVFASRQKPELRGSSRRLVASPQPPLSPPPQTLYPPSRAPG